MLERKPNKRKSCKNVIRKEGPKVEVTQTTRKKTRGVAIPHPGFLQKLQHRSKADARSTEKDYSAFGSVTAYEKKVIERLRADGLTDTEIGKCLREL